MSNIFKTYLTVFSHSKYVLLINIADKVFGFVIFLLLARNLPTEIFGQIVTLFTLSVVFVTIFDFGLPIFLQREISVSSGDSNEIFSKVFSANLFIFIAYAALSFIYFKTVYSEIPLSLFILIALMTYISSLVNLCNKALSGLNNFKSQFIAFTLPRILILAVFIAGFYMFSAGLNALMLVMLIGFILNLVLIFAYLKKAGIIFSLNYFRLNNISAILKFSLPLGFTVIFNFLYDKIDVLLISIIRDYTEVAFYNVGYGLFKAAMLSFSFLLVSGFTEVSAISSDKPRVKLFFKQYAKIIIVICVIMSVLLFFLSDFITNLLYTEKFQSSAIVVRILSLGIIAVGLNNLTGIVINGMGYFKVVMYITLYGLVLNLVLNAVFIPRYGIIAASVVTLITEYFVFLTEYFYLKKILK